MRKSFPNNPLPGFFLVFISLNVLNQWLEKRMELPGLSQSSFLAHRGWRPG
jgi:hypothetical protein